MHANKKVLLLDTNVSSYPIYKYLTKEGYDVHTIGKNPSDFLAKCANRYTKIDYSNKSDLIDYINKNNIDFIIPGCNDASYEACTSINTDGRFPGLETINNNEILNNKEKFRQFSSTNNLPIPAVYSDKSISAINQPLIIKPTDAFSGKGITVITNSNKEYLNTAISDAIFNSRSKSYLIEEYVKGQLHSHSAFLSNGAIIQDFFVEEMCVANPFAVDTSRVVNNLNDNIATAIRDAIGVIASKLNLVDGLIHTQFICNENSVWLIEPTRRCPGDLYSRLIELSTGFNYAENYTRPFLGLAYNINKDNSYARLVFRHTITSPKKNKFCSFKKNHEINIYEYIPLALAGDHVDAAPAGRIGIFFATSNCETEFNDAYQATIKRTLYDIT
jgi:predicted ATP-grasp superfamily ATP-dependent carboligase